MFGELKIWLLQIRRLFAIKDANFLVVLVKCFGLANKGLFARQGALG